MAISNDNEFKTALNKLTVAQQRQVASRFVGNVLPLCKDARVSGAVTAARREDITDSELAALFQAAKSASVESFTQCGREADWLAQAGHFVAEAAMACVKAAEAGDNLAWDAGMSARMARTCETIAGGAGTENQEADAQYRILTEFLKQ
ncbi:MAG TPA: hypothetical protein VEP67_07850 [Thiobacillaceae bacterium]|nr:hypothetical protein [Thiobacillaceae bacterium]